MAAGCAVIAQLASHSADQLFEDGSSDLFDESRAPGAPAIWSALQVDLVAASRTPKMLSTPSGLSPLTELPCLAQCSDSNARLYLGEVKSRTLEGALTVVSVGASCVLTWRKVMCETYGSAPYSPHRSPSAAERRAAAFVTASRTGRP